MKNKETVRGGTVVEQRVIQLFSVHKKLYSEKPVVNEVVGWWEGLGKNPLAKPNNGTPQSKEETL